MKIMEFSETSWSILICFFIFILLFISIFYLILNILRKRVLCDCEICQTYISSSWVAQFPNLCDWYTHLLSKSPTQTIHIHVLGNIITANPTNVEYMLKTKFENFPKGKPFSMILGDLLGRGIFNVDGDLWKFQRKMANLELGRNSIRSYAFEVIHQEIHHRLIPLLDSFSRKEQHHGTLDLQDVFKRFSFDCICKFSFGLDPKCLEISLPLSEFATSFDLASNLSAKRAMNISPLIWKIKKIFNIGSEKKLRKAIQKINILANEMIKQKRKLGNNSPEHKDLLSKFMVTINDEAYLRDIVISFILAGRDTVASALTSFFWHMAKNPHVQESILSEANRILGENQDYCLTSCDELKDLHYLQASIHESMRLLPGIQFDSKFCLQDDVLPDGVFVKKGTRVTYHPYAMGRMEKIWGEDCLEFKPERWLTENGQFSQENPFKYPVFQAGLRVCLGKEMAIVELKTVAISLLRRFRIELVEKEGSLSSSSSSPLFLPGLTATLRGGLPVLVQERWAKDE